MSGLDVILNDFQKDVERAEHLLALVKAFREFGASPAPEQAAREGDPWPAATMLLEASKMRRTDLPILSGSLQLYLAGRFEYCIRQIVEVVADELATRASKYTDLPDSIRAELKTKTLDIVQNPKRFNHSDTQADALLEAYVTSTNSIKPPVIISSNILSLTDSNMKDRTLAEILKRIGMQDFWKEVGKQASMKIALETGTDSTTTAEAISRLNAIMDERNQVAHPTATTKFPDPDQVLQAARFLKILAATTVDLAKVYLAAYRPLIAPPVPHQVAE